MKRAVNAGLRFLRGLRMPSKARNARLLSERGETATSLVVRDATVSDIPALARLHVKALERNVWLAAKWTDVRAS
jgi:hypothetical protein